MWVDGINTTGRDAMLIRRDANRNVWSNYRRTGQLITSGANAGQFSGFSWAAGGIWDNDCWAIDFTNTYNRSLYMRQFRLFVCPAHSNGDTFAANPPDSSGNVTPFSPTGPVWGRGCRYWVSAHLIGGNSSTEEQSGFLNALNVHNINSERGVGRGSRLTNHRTVFGDPSLFRFPITPNNLRQVGHPPLSGAQTVVPGVADPFNRSMRQVTFAFNVPLEVPPGRTACVNLEIRPNEWSTADIVNESNIQNLGSGAGRMFMVRRGIPMWDIEQDFTPDPVATPYIWRMSDFDLVDQVPISPPEWRREAIVDLMTNQGWLRLDGNQPPIT